MKDRWKEHYHFVGIGGVGMSAIAGVLLQKGYRVSGSDLRESDITRRLEWMGARIFIGHRGDNVNGAGVVVVSTAVPPDNEEVKQARLLGIPIVHRSDMLARLMEEKKGIGVAGSHGKTTTTSMIALVRERGGWDPTVLVGGELNDIGGNAKLGTGEFLVAETDESDGSFLKLSPYVAVVTNVEDDHLDYYGTYDNIISAFTRFINGVRPGGWALLCADDPTLARLAGEVSVPVTTYGLEGSPDYLAEDIRYNGHSTSFRVRHGPDTVGEIRLRVPGRHNVSNALAAAGLALRLGLDFGTVAGALAAFTEVRRRFQTIGIVNDIRIVDDYAHHPTEVMATIRTARQLSPGRVVCVFQPHRYTRTRFLHRAFGRAFSGADEVIITDIYPAGEKPLEGVSARLIVDAIQEHDGREVKYIPDRDDISRYLAETLRPGDLVLAVGAGDVWMIATDLVKRLRKTGVEDRECLHFSGSKPAAGGKTDDVVTNSC